MVIMGSVEKKSLKQLVRNLSPLHWHTDPALLLKLFLTGFPIEQFSSDSLWKLLQLKEMEALCSPLHILHPPLPHSLIME